MGSSRWRHEYDLSVLGLSVQETNGLVWFLSNFDVIITQIRLMGSDVPLMYGKIQKPFAASGAVVDSC